MKKLLLTSDGLVAETTDEFLKMLNKGPEETRMCFIPTASDPLKDKWGVTKDLDRLKELGFQTYDVDLKKENENSLSKKLLDFDVIFVEGGNTFYLLKYVRESGFYEVLLEFLGCGGIYVGVSAGSVIAGLNIESAGWKHSDRNIVDLKDLTGLRLVPFVISVHIDESNLEIIRNAVAKVDYPVVALTDKQAILVENDKPKIVGTGERYIFNTEEQL